MYANETPVVASGNVNIYAPEYKEEKKKVIVDKIKGIEPVGVKEPKQIIKAEAPRVVVPKVPHVPGTKRVAAPKIVVPKAGEPKKITYIYFTDDKNNKITEASYDGRMIRAHFGSTGLINHKVIMRVYDHEVMAEDHFLDATPEFTIKESPCFVEIALTEKLKKRGANLYSDNVFVEIEIMETKAHVMSTQIKVNTNNSFIDIARNITKARVEDREAKKEPTTCFCKQKENQFYWSTKLTCEQRKKVLQVCKNLWPASKPNEKASELMSIIHLETGNKQTFKPYADNDRGFSGLIQFSDASAKSLGTTRSKLKAMTFIEQMDYVEKYLSKNKEKLTTMTDLYLMVLKPNAVGQGTNPNFVIFDESIEVPDGDGSNTSQAQRMININQEPWVTKYGYASNPTYHLEKGEKVLRKKWVYTRQRFEQRYGFIDGKTIVKDVTDVLLNGHYNPGKAQVFIGKCENIKEEKVEGKQNAPWVDVAWEELNTYKGKTEVESPLKERVSEYFKLSGIPSYNHTDAWCATFIFWCFQHTKDYMDTNVKGNVGAYDWAEKGNSKIIGNPSKDGWIQGEKTEPFVGAIIIFTFSHVAIIVGENSNGTKYIYLGGNQGSNTTGGQKICLGSVLKTSKDIFMIMKPINYSPTNDEKQLPKYDVNAENSNSSSR